MSQVILATAVIAWIFVYIAMKIDIQTDEETFSVNAAIIQFTNLFLGYGTILTTFFLAIQETNYTGLSLIPGRGTLLSGVVNIYALLMLLIFFFLLWNFITQLKKENLENGGPD